MTARITDADEVWITDQLSRLADTYDSTEDSTARLDAADGEPGRFSRRMLVAAVAMALLVVGTATLVWRTGPDTQQVGTTDETEGVTSRAAEDEVTALASKCWPYFNAAPGYGSTVGLSDAEVPEQALKKYLDAPTPPGNPVLPPDGYLSAPFVRSGLPEQWTFVHVTDEDPDVVIRLVKLATVSLEAAWTPTFIAFCGYVPPGD